MLMIRFQRIGRKNDAAFRMAVLEKTAGPKAGKYVDLVGNYNPKTKVMNANAEAIRSWMGKGAQVSPSLMNLLINKGVMEGKKTPSISKKNMEKNKPAEVVAEAASAAPEEAPAAAPAEVIEAPAEEVAAPVEETPVEAPAETSTETPAETEETA